MLSKILGLIQLLTCKVRYGSKVSFDGIPWFVSHLNLCVKSGSIKVGRNFTMKQGVYMAAVNGGKITVGDHVSLNRNCMLICHDAISIGEGCAIGPNTVFFDHDHNFGETGIREGYKTAPIVIEKNCWIGAGVTILRGSHIGEGSVIGAGAVVSGVIPAHSLVTANRDLHIRPIENRS